MYNGFKTSTKQAVQGRAKVKRIPSSKKMCPSRTSSYFFLRVVHITRFQGTLVTTFQRSVVTNFKIQI